MEVGAGFGMSYKSIPSFESFLPETNTAKKDLDNMQVAKFTNLKPTTTSISLRLSDSLLDGIRLQANKLDVPYQSLMKVWLTEKLGEASKRT